MNEHSTAAPWITTCFFCAPEEIREYAEPVAHGGQEAPDAVIRFGRTLTPRERVTPSPEDLVRDLDPGEWTEEILVESSYGTSSPSGKGPLWSLPLDPLHANLGNVIRLAAVPATLLLHLRIVAYGAGTQTLEVSLVAAESEQAVIENYQVKIAFDPLVHPDLLGVASLVITLPRVSFPAPGLYWVLVSITGGHTITLPLYLQETGVSRG